MATPAVDLPIYRTVPRQSKRAVQKDITWLHPKSSTSVTTNLQQTTACVVKAQSLLLLACRSCGANIRTNRNMCCGVYVNGSWACHAHCHHIGVDPHRRRKASELEPAEWPTNGRSGASVLFRGNASAELRLALRQAQSNDNIHKDYAEQLTSLQCMRSRYKHSPYVNMRRSAAGEVGDPNMVWRRVKRA